MPVAKLYKDELGTDQASSSGEDKKKSELRKPHLLDVQRSLDVGNIGINVALERLDVYGLPYSASHSVYYSVKYECVTDLDRTSRYYLRRMVD